MIFYEDQDGLRAEEPFLFFRRAFERLTVIDAWKFENLVEHVVFPISNSTPSWSMVLSFKILIPPLTFGADVGMLNSIYRNLFKTL